MRALSLILGLTIFLAAVPGANPANRYKEEIGFGNFTDQYRVARYLLILDEVVNRQIDEIGNRVAKAAGRSDLTYTFRLINDSTINAFATSGGFIYINTGLLDIVESSDELAAVIAHEVVHINEVHLLKRLYSTSRKRVAGQLGGILLGLVLRDIAAEAVSEYTLSPQNAMDLGSLGSQLGEKIAVSLAEASITGYARELELQADLLAIEYLQDAGYDPYAYVRFLKRMQSIRDRLGLKADHYASALINKSPGLNERIKQVEQALAKASN